MDINETGKSNDRVIFEQVGYLKGRYEDMATKADIESLNGKIDTSVSDLNGKIDTSVSELKGFIESRISKSEIRSLKWFVGIWASVAGVGPPLVNAIASFFKGGGS